MKRERGITLIEVMITIALVAILLVLGLPAFGTMITNMRVRATAEDLLASVQLARTEAMKIGQPVSLRIDGNTDAWTILKTIDSQTIHSRTSSVSAVVVQGDNGDTLTFDNLGLRTQPGGADLRLNVSSSTGTCQSAGSVRCLAVLVRPGGMIRLCDPERPLGDPQSCTL